MAKCAFCNSTILFGGARDGDLRFCNETCHGQGVLLSVSRSLPEDTVRQAVWEVHQGPCPRCRGAGPVDVHTSHRIWSALLMTSWRSTPRVSCRRCGVKSQIGDMAFSGVLGWWGFPWGLVMTPVQIVRNVTSMARPPDPLQPSEELSKMIRLQIAADAVDRQAAAAPGG
jgi:hypothetical protein